jgi:hypothetical protein
MLTDLHSFFVQPAMRIHRTLFWLFAISAGCLSGLMLTGCNSSPIEKKAQQNLNKGVAADMGEAVRMAHDYYWVENAQKQDNLRREEREKIAQDRLKR